MVTSSRGLFKKQIYIEVFHYHVLYWDTIFPTSSCYTTPIQDGPGLFAHPSIPKHSSRGGSPNTLTGIYRKKLARTVVSWRYHWKPNTVLSLIDFDTHHPAKMSEWRSTGRVTTTDIQGAMGLAWRPVEGPKRIRRGSAYNGCTRSRSSVSFIKGFFQTVTKSIGAVTQGVGVTRSVCWIFACR